MKNKITFEQLKNAVNSGDYAFAQGDNGRAVDVGVDDDGVIELHAVADGDGNLQSYSAFQCHNTTIAVDEDGDLKLKVSYGTFDIERDAEIPVEAVMYLRCFRRTTASLLAKSI